MFLIDVYRDVSGIVVFCVCVLFCVCVVFCRLCVDLPAVKERGRRCRVKLAIDGFSLITVTVTGGAFVYLDKD